MRLSALALLALIAFAAVAKPVRAQDDGVDVDEEDIEELTDRAFLIVRRVVADKRPVVGKATKVTIEVYNAGSTSALDVAVQEPSWPAELFAVSGDLSAKFESIPAGTVEQVTYTITPQAAGLHHQAPIRVTYQAEEDDEDSVKSTGTQWAAVQTFTLTDDWKLRALELGSTVTGGTITTISGWKYLLYAITAAFVAKWGYDSYNSFQESSKNKRRARALAELQAEDYKTK